MTEKSDISINKRLKQWMDDLDDSISTISDKTGISRTTLYDVTKEGATIKHIYLERLSEFYDIDLNWLIKRKKNRTNGELNSKTAIYNIEEGKGRGLDDDEFYQIPFYPHVKASAGGGLIPQESKPPLQVAFRKYYINETLQCQASDLVVITAEGESMVPRIEDGDAIMIDRSKQTPTGKIMVVRIDEAVNCKYVQELPGHKYRLMSENKAYESFEIAAADPGFDIIGQVVWRAQNLV